MTSRGTLFYPPPGSVDRLVARWLADYLAAFSKTGRGRQQLWGDARSLHALSSARDVEPRVPYIEISAHVSRTSDGQDHSHSIRCGVAHSHSCVVTLTPNQPKPILPSKKQ